VFAGVRVASWEVVPFTDVSFVSLYHVDHLYLPSYNSKLEGQSVYCLLSSIHWMSSTDVFARVIVTS
jgi:hypothetical protein